MGCDSLLVVVDHGLTKGVILCPTKKSKPETQRIISNPKFSPKQEGPFTIMKVLSSIIYQLRLPKTWKIHPVFHASLLTPYRENAVHGKNFPMSPPDLINREEEYKIEKIIRHCGSLTSCSFLISWEEYLAEEDS